jgi:hypothetical protein
MSPLVELGMLGTRATHVGGSAAAGFAGSGRGPFPVSCDESSCKL